MKRSTILAAVVLAAFPGACVARAQAATTPDAEPTLTAAMRTEVLEGVLRRVHDLYVFPEVAGKMETAIHERMARREYDSLSTGSALAERLTKDLQEVSHDKHLRVFYSVTARPLPKEGDRDSDAERARRRRFDTLTNYGFEKIERLAGNVGYLQLFGFADPQRAGEKAAAAMAFLADTDALIIDLRGNGGGHPAMVALLCSYLFDGSESIHLNDLYYRPEDTTQQFWTLPYVPGRRYAGKDVYVLTSKRTFSGAEEFTYNLKNLKRATIIGETTGGGAHPGGVRPINEHFAVFVPTGRAINPISKTNWEGTGVTPDVPVPAEGALRAAHIAALKKMLARASDAEDRERLQNALEAAEKEPQTVTQARRD